MSRFTADVYQNEYLAPGATDVDAVVTITATGTGSVAAASGDAAVVLIIDTSGSMAVPRTAIKEARRAAIAAVELIPDGVAFGVIAGTETARLVHPSTGELVPASASARAEAAKQIERMKPHGGTAMGRWLAKAAELFAAARATRCHAILLTDGEDQHETADELAAVLTHCEGRFQCDCRGVGTDWRVDELRRIASALLGTVDIVAAPEGLEQDFRTMMQTAMSRGAGDVVLRLWTPVGTGTVAVKQVAPAIEDLTARGRRTGELVVEYPTGAWGDETRDYHVRLRVPPRAVGDEMLAGRVSVVADGEVVGQGLVRAVWTEDAERSAAISREVAHYTGQAELASAIQDGLEARRTGDEAGATFKLGRAVQLAAAAGNDETLTLLRRVVDVEDAATGTVRLKARVQQADEMSLDTRSTKTVRVGRAAP